MCLKLSVELPMGKRDAELIPGQYNSANLDLRFDGTTRPWGRGKSRLSISEKGQGCACSMLTDEADWNAPAWDIRQPLPKHLAMALLFISERSPGGFDLEAIWAGDKPERSIQVTLAEMLEIIQKNQMGTKVRYIVRAA